MNSDSGVWRVYCAADRRGGPYWCEVCQRDIHPEPAMDEDAIIGWVYTHDPLPHPEWEHERMTILREALAAYAHDAWSGWMRHLFSKSTENEDGSVTIPAEMVSRWRRQVSTPYTDLSTAEKESDRQEADLMIDIFSAGGG